MSGKNHSALFPIKPDLRVTDSIRIILQKHFMKVEEEKDTSLSYILKIFKKKKEPKKQNNVVIKSHNRYSFLKLKGMWGLLSYELLTSRRFSTTEGLPGASGNKPS